MLILIIGGSGSGKSEFGEKIALSFGGEIHYVATMYPYGEAAEKRIKRHKALREGKGFKVTECYRDIGSINLKGTVIAECMSNLLANEMFGENPKDSGYILNCIKNIKCENLIVISNNISEDGNIYSPETMRYIRELNNINTGIAKIADKVYEVVAGIALEVNV